MGGGARVRGKDRHSFSCKSLMRMRFFAVETGLKKSSIMKGFLVVLCFFIVSFKWCDAKPVEHIACSPDASCPEGYVCGEGSYCIHILTTTLSFGSESGDGVDVGSSGGGYRKKKDAGGEESNSVTTRNLFFRKKKSASVKDTKVGMYRFTNNKEMGPNTKLEKTNINIKLSDKPQTKSLVLLKEKLKHLSEMKKDLLMKIGDIQDRIHDHEVKTAAVVDGIIVEGQEKKFLVGDVPGDFAPLIDLGDYENFL